MESNIGSKSTVRVEGFVELQFTSTAILFTCVDEWPRTTKINGDNFSSSPMILTYLKFSR